MKKYTTKEAVEAILLAPGLPAKYVMLKHRYKKGELSQKAIDKLLAENGFVISQETLYIKK